MKKVFASDFDGTLYFYQAEVKLPPESVKKILEYQQAGHLFGLCTGRQVGGLTPFLTGFVEPDFCITSSGANIVDRKLQPIRKRGVPREIADAIIRDTDPTRYRMTLDVEGRICVFAEMDYPGEYSVITGTADAPEGLIHQVSIHTESLEEAAAFVKAINEKYGAFVEAFQNVVEVDIAPRGCSKGEGVQFLRRWLEEQFGPCRLYGIGDSLNDLPLIAAADVSYTFPYAPEALRSRVTKVVPTICEALEDSMSETLS